VSIGTVAEVQAVPAPSLILEVSHLGASFLHGNRRWPVLEDVSFHVREAETLCIVGASGSGKSVCCRSLLRLLPPAASVSGAVRLFGDNILTLSDSELRCHRGGSIGMVFQNPFESFNPTATIGSHFFESMRAHKRISRADAMESAIPLLIEMDLDSPVRLLAQYPHQLSGGMLQRVMIAIALAPAPCILVADEPTGSVDVLSRNKILSVLSSLKRTRRMAQILVTHDMRVAAAIADHILILIDGRVVEYGSCAAIVSNPQTSYARELRRASFGN
jgi:ABC-type glutathione transport system ATPase component